MKHHIRRRIGMIAVAILTALLAAVVAPAPAQAAAEPTTSPSAAVRYFTTNLDSISCGPGYACVVVPYRNDTNAGFVFKFYYYGTYYLSNWYGIGMVTNYQTDGAAVRLLDSRGAQIQCIAPPPAQWTTSVNWDPVYRIQLTASSC